MEKKKLTLYHGVRKSENVDTIIKNGFDLTKINPLWNNDYAVSTLKNPNTVLRFFGRNVPILKLKFDGVIATVSEVGYIEAKTPQDHTRQVLAMGIDAMVLNDKSQVFIYNPKAIKEITLWEQPKTERFGTDMITSINEFKMILEQKTISPVLYHGTTAKFDTFEIGKDIKNPLYGDVPDDHGLGVFFTDNKTMAEWFAGMTDFDSNKEKYVKTKNKGRVIEAKATLNNPYVIDVLNEDLDMDSAQIYFREIENAGSADEYRKKLMDKGHDGIILKRCNTNYYEDGTYQIWVVFNTKDIQIL